jgi:hypothetical protein
MRVWSGTPEFAFPLQMRAGATTCSSRLSIDSFGDSQNHAPASPERGRAVTAAGGRSEYEAFCAAGTSAVSARLHPDAVSARRQHAVCYLAGL